MDTYLAIVSKRDERRYAPTPIADDVTTRILDAGRVSGNSQNRQAWRFVVVESPDRREAIADAVYAPANVRGAALVVAVVARAFDAGRAAQNMMIAAWHEGITSCPNGLRDPDAAKEALDLGADEELAIVLSFGYPATGRSAERRSAEAWSRGANRKPLEEVVRRV